MSKKSLHQCPKKRGAEVTATPVIAELRKGRVSRISTCDFRMYENDRMINVVLNCIKARRHS